MKGRRIEVARSVANGSATIDSVADAVGVTYDRAVDLVRGWLDIGRAGDGRTMVVEITPDGRTAVARKKGKAA